VRIYILVEESEPWEVGVTFKKPFQKWVFIRLGGKRQRFFADCF
jgi:hypothetical protein